MVTSDLNLPLTVEQLILLYRANEAALQEASLVANHEDLETYQDLKQRMIETWKANEGGDTAELHELAFGGLAE